MQSNRLTDISSRPLGTACIAVFGAAADALAACLAAQRALHVPGWRRLELPSRTQLTPDRRFAESTDGLAHRRSGAS